MQEIRIQQRAARSQRKLDARGKPLPRTRRQRHRVLRWMVRFYDFISRMQSALYKQRQYKWIQEQHAYQWELFDIEQDATDKSTQTFDFVAGISFMSNVRLMVFVVILGGFIGFASTVFQYAEFGAHHYYHALEVYLAHYFGHGWIYFHWTIGASLSGLFVGYITKVYIPECSGAGADATKICMAVKAPVPLFVGVARIIFSSIYLGMGNPLGIEAPTLHVTAAVASSFLRVGSKFLPEDFRLEHLPTWVLVGMTAGLASAFVAPLAGMLYAVEEYMNIRKIGLTVVLIGVASTFASLVSVTIRGALDKPFHAHRFNDDVLRVAFKPHPHIFVLALLISVLCSVVGLTFQKVTLRLRHFNNNFVSQYVSAKYFGGIAGIVIGLLGCITYVLTHSHGSWSVGAHHYAQLLTEPSCEEMDALYLRYESVSHPGEYHLIHQSEGTSDPDMVFAKVEEHCRYWHEHLIYFIGRGLMVIVAVSVGGPGGIFFPSLLLGGSLGAALSGLFAKLDPEQAHEYRVLIVLGMVGLFASLIRTPMTAILVTYEMSGYGAIGLVPGLTFNMILTSMLCFLICEYVEHIDFVAQVMMQDGIDFHELFERGLTLEMEASTRDADHEVAESKTEAPKSRGTASYMILVEAANRADIEQTLADNIWMHRLATNYNVKGIHEHLLRGARVDMNWVNKQRNNQTCMQICIDNELQNAIRLILFKKSDPEKDFGKPLISPLLLACRKGLAQASIALIAYGANPSRQDKHSADFPIHAAAASGNRELVLTLIQASASLNVTNKAGETPLLIAARNRHQHLVTILTAEAWKMKRDFSGVKVLQLSRNAEPDDRRRSIVVQKARRGLKRESITNMMADKNILGVAAPRLQDLEEDGSVASSKSTFNSRMSDMSSHEDEEVAKEMQLDKILNLHWFTQDSLVARTFKGFVAEVENDIKPLSELGDAARLKALWTEYREGSAVFQISKKTLTRHVSSLEIQLFACIGGGEYVLMEQEYAKVRYPTYASEYVYSHNDWAYSLEEGLMALLKFTPVWQGENLVDPTHVQYTSTQTEKTVSKNIEYTTVFHMHGVALEVGDPSSPKVVQQKIGLPVGEQFIRCGKRFRWVPSIEAEDLAKSTAVVSKPLPRREQPAAIVKSPSSLFTNLMKL
eukprot:GEMP01003061.1.p1 GENE.GEMP01003061.1~~GEMP01003061.1.p1  ORF type:complete len:1146 (+),score=144.05 GEMP01003061.1:291-3728(+)